MEFKEIENYQVRISREGHVVSTITGKTINPHRDQYGYARIHVELSNGKRKGLYVHRLLAMAFIPNPDNKPCVNHIDCNKQNNSLDNLEWCTHKENSVHASKKGRYTIHSHRSKDRALRSKAVKSLVDHGALTKDEIAELFMTDRSNIKI